MALEMGKHHLQAECFMDREVYSQVGRSMTVQYKYIDMHRRLAAAAMSLDVMEEAARNQRQVVKQTMKMVKIAARADRAALDAEEREWLWGSEARAVRQRRLGTAEGDTGGPEAEADDVAASSVDVDSDNCS
jgi:hypothetical protein